MLVRIWIEDSNGYVIEQYEPMGYDEARVWLIEREMIDDEDIYPVAYDKAFSTEIEAEETLIALTNGFYTHASYKLEHPNGDWAVLHLETA